MRAVVVAVALLASAARAEERVPESLGVLVMLKVLTYDAGFDARGAGEFVVLVPFAAGHESDASALVKTASSLDVKSIKERSLRFVTVPISELPKQAASAVLLHANFPFEAAKSVLAAAKARRWYALSLEESLVPEGAVLGVGLSDGKPQPLINVTAARSVGAEFAAAVLKRARTFQ